MLARTFKRGRSSRAPAMTAAVLDSPPSRYRAEEHWQGRRRRGEQLAHSFSPRTLHEPGEVTKFDEFVRLVAATSLTTMKNEALRPRRARRHRTNHGFRLTRETPPARDLTNPRRSDKARWRYQRRGRSATSSSSTSSPSSPSPASMIAMPTTSFQPPRSPQSRRQSTLSKTPPRGAATRRRSRSR